MPDAPVVIETDRLILRPHDLSDFEDVHALWSDPEVVCHIYDRPQTAAEAWSRLLRYRGHWALLGYGYWAVVERATGRFMGELGFANYLREIEPDMDGRPEAGWVMARHAHGRGVAYEAMQAALGWCDAHLDARGTWAMITPSNHSSLRLAQKLGFARTLDAQFNGKPRHIYERARS
ncbi:MAG: GNAT family N-acetyltransferase [Pseudomonadota bacterium]